MTKRQAALVSAGALLASWLVNLRNLASARLDLDSFTAMNAFFLARAPLPVALRWLADSRGVFSSYEPVPNFLYWLIYGALGLQGPEGFRWLQVLLTAANGVLVAGLAARWARLRWAACGCLAFILMPSPNWSCVGVPHYLATFFVLAGLLWHIRWRDSGSLAHGAGLSACALLAALSKESGLALPLIALCLELAQRRPLRPTLLALTPAFIALAPIRGDLSSRWTWPHPTQVAPFCAVLAAGAGALWARRRSAAFFLAWAAIGLLPVSGLLPARLPAHVQGLEARYLFLPVAGLACLFALGLEGVQRRFSSRAALTAAFVALSAAAAAGWDRLEDSLVAPLSFDACREGWSNQCLEAVLPLALERKRAPEAFVQAAARLRLELGETKAERLLDYFAAPLGGAWPGWRCAQETAMARRDLAGCAQALRSYEAGRFEEAAAAWPGFAEAWLARAQALRVKGDNERALEAGRRAARCPMASFLLPDSPWTDQELKAVRARQRPWLSGSAEPVLDGFSPESLESLAWWDPDDMGLWRAAALRLQDAGRPERAYVLLARLAAREPSDAGVWSDLGVAAALSGRKREAADDFRRALSLDPGRAEASQSLRALGER